MMLKLTVTRALTLIVDLGGLLAAAATLLVSRITLRVVCIGVFGGFGVLLTPVLLRLFLGLIGHATGIATKMISDVMPCYAAFIRSVRKSEIADSS